MRVSVCACARSIEFEVQHRTAVLDEAECRVTAGWIFAALPHIKNSVALVRERTMHIRNVITGVRVAGKSALWQSFFL